jgi:hypothetical protein
MRQGASSSAVLKKFWWSAERSLRIDHEYEKIRSRGLAIFGVAAARSPVHTVDA